MPLISPNDEVLLELLSEEVTGKIPSSCEITINRFKLREFIFLRAKKEILKQHPDWSQKGKLQPGALTRLSQINAVIDLNNVCSSLVDDLVHFLTTKTEEPPEVSIQVSFPQKSSVKTPLRAVDQRVGPGGMTALHMAAYSGNFEEVKRLVEVEGANVHVKDNSGYTPWDRANLNDYTKIKDYLSNF